MKRVVRGLNTSELRRPRAPGSRDATEELRRIRVGEREVEFVLRRSTRKTLSLQVGRNGVRLSAPATTPVGEAERFLLANGDWLLDRLGRLDVRREEDVFRIEDGARFPLLGRVSRVRLDGGGARRVRWVHAADGVEELWLPQSGRQARAMVSALQGRALGWFGGRVEEYCHRLGLAVPVVRVTTARTRWGSCSARSGIRLHWRLIHLPPQLGDYVVAHEVAHLLEMNHSARFWAVVASLYPDWRTARAQLRQAADSLPVIGEVRT
ncbi:MAG: M48 family metallopeptidase [Rhodocyclaceae bacterium]